IVQAGNGKQNCLKVAKEKVAACQDIEGKLLDLYAKKLAILDAWQKAYADKDTPKTWAGKVAYNDIDVEIRQTIWESWKNNFSNAKWTPPSEPSDASYYLNMYSSIQHVRNSICKMIPRDDRIEQCEKDHGDLAIA